MMTAKHPITLWRLAQSPPLSQKEAAERLGVSEPYLSLVVNFKRDVSLGRAEAWAAITGLPRHVFRAAPLPVPAAAEAGAP